MLIEIALIGFLELLLFGDEFGTFESKVSIQMMAGVDQLVQSAV